MGLKNEDIRNEVQVREYGKVVSLDKDMFVPLC